METIFFIFAPAFFIVLTIAIPYSFKIEQDVKNERFKKLCDEEIAMRKLMNLGINNI